MPTILRLSPRSTRRSVVGAGAAAAALAVSVAGYALASSSGGTPAPVSASSVPAPTGVALVGYANAAAATTKSTTTKTTTSKVTTPSGTLQVPGPSKLVPTPDPRSTACKANPAADFCSLNSVRYIVAMTPLKAHDLWLPVLRKWGLTDVQDSCVEQKAQAGEVCAIRGTHSSKSLSVLFKATYDAKYAPTAVESQVSGIRQKALKAAASATNSTAAARIMTAANKQIAAIQKAADSYNAAHPKTTVNVVLSPAS